MNTFIVTQSSLDAHIFRKLVHRDLGESATVRYVTGRGQKRATGAAGRTLLLQHSDSFVVVILDGGDGDPAFERRWLATALDEIAPPSRWRSFVLFPSLDAIVRSELHEPPDTDLGATIERASADQLRALAESPQLQPILAAIREAVAAVAA